MFAFTQVTTVISDDPTWRGLGHGLLILAALWWAWAAYAWLTNTVDPDVGAVWGAILVAMAAMFVAALAVPDAFGRHGVVFGVAFLIVHFHTARRSPVRLPLGNTDLFVGRDQILVSLGDLIGNIYSVKVPD